MHIINYTGNGNATEFDFSFPFFKPADIKVSINSQVLQPGQFTVTLNGALQSDGMYYGGRVIFTQPPALGAQISIWRKIDLSRIIDYQPTLPIQTETLNADFNFMLEYMRDLYELDGDVANIENGIQFLDFIQDQIEKLGNLGELARKDEIPDLTDYAKKSEIPDVSNFAEKQDIPDISNLASKDEIPDISNLATKDEIPDISNLAKKSDIPSLTGYAKKTDIPDVSNFATKDEIPNISNLATKDEIPDISNLATKDEIPDTSKFALANHTHNMSAYATKTDVNNQVARLDQRIDSIDPAASFPIQFDDDDEPDIVVKTQLPTESNNFTWYRKYKSGWVEQGGISEILLRNTGYNNAIPLPVKMADVNYSCTINLTNEYGGRSLGAMIKYFMVDFLVVGGYGTASETTKCMWSVRGMAATAE